MRHAATTSAGATLVTRAGAVLARMARCSTASHVSQLAGSLWADMLRLGDIVDPARRQRALNFIGQHNVAAVPGCVADECSLDGQAMQSMAALAMGNYAAQAIAAGSADHGWAAVERIYHARYDHDGCPWDAPLQWSGEGNLQPQWGRWYMSHPASWFVLWALGGARIDRLRGTLEVTPSWPDAWGDRLAAMPVFLPGFQARVDASRAQGGWSVNFTIVAAWAPVTLHRLSTRLPSRLDPAALVASAAGLVGDVAIGPDGVLAVNAPFAVVPGASFTLRAERA